MWKSKIPVMLKMARFRFYILFLLSTFVIGACSLKPTQYKERGAFSHEGFTEQKNGEGVYAVSFTGVGHESPETIESLLDRRCAEITQRDGYDWFTFYSKSRNDYVATGSVSKSVPAFYGVIHLKRGAVETDGLSAKEVLAKPLPQGVQN